MQWILCKHKQVFISTTIYQDTAEKILKRTYFSVFEILGLCLLLKVLKNLKGCGQIMKDHMKT